MSRRWILLSIFKVLLKHLNLWSQRVIFIKNFFELSLHILNFVFIRLYLYIHFRCLLTTIILWLVSLFDLILENLNFRITITEFLFKIIDLSLILLRRSSIFALNLNNLFFKISHFGVEICNLFLTILGRLLGDL